MSILNCNDNSISRSRTKERGEEREIKTREEEGRGAERKKEGEKGVSTLYNFIPLV